MVRCRQGPGSSVAVFRSNYFFTVILTRDLQPPTLAHQTASACKQTQAHGELCAAHLLQVTDADLTPELAREVLGVRTKDELEEEVRMPVLC